MIDVMAWLAAGIPLTLGVDLLDERGPDSRRIARSERADAGMTRAMDELLTLPSRRSQVRSA